jgi:hypothetical protein
MLSAQAWEDMHRLCLLMGDPRNVTLSAMQDYIRRASYATRVLIIDVLIEVYVVRWIIYDNVSRKNGFTACAQT